MKISTLLLSILLFTLTSCEPPTPTVANAKNSISADETPQLQQLMDTQQTAWNQGDIEGFMEAYWNSDSLMFIGKSGLKYGYQKVLANYKKSYPDTIAMGQLQFDNKDVRMLGEKAASVTGKWTLYRQTDTLSGHYLLVWQKIKGQWCITQDHSS